MSSGFGHGRFAGSQPYMTRAERRRSRQLRARIRRASGSLTRSRALRGAGVAALAAVVIGSTTTLARFSDMAIITADISSGIELAALSSDETILALSNQPGTELARLSTEELVPGATVEVPIRLANNSPGSAISPTVRVTAEPGEGTDAELLEHVTAMILQEEGDERRDITEVTPPSEGGSPALEVRAEPEILEPRTGDAQQAGETYTGGPDASAAYTILFAVEEAPELRDVSGASWNLAITLEGMSHQ